ALGDGATSPVTSAIQYFREEFEAGLHTPASVLFPPERTSLFDYTPRHQADRMAGTVHA
ncbi:MAG: NADH-quinone oxidoreductase subunit F, partial [Cellulomonas sp.]